MTLTTTDGKVHDFVDACSHCQLSTAGEHESNCPCYQPSKIEVALQIINTICYGRLADYQPETIKEGSE